MRKPVVIVVLLAVLAGAGWWWLRPKAVDASAPLAYVPANTPYVMANVEPMPAALQAASMRQLGLQRELLAAQWQEAKQALGKHGEQSKPVLALLEALEAEFGDKSLEQQLALLGLDPATTHYAIYGLGLTPVMRIELAKPDALTQTIARVETRLGTPLQQAKVGTQAYWQIPLGDAPLQAIAAVVGSHLVLSMAARDADEPTLRSVLGLDRPAQSLLASGGLSALNSEFGFTPSFSGYIDSARALDTISGEMTLADRALWAAVGVAPPKPEPLCQDEYAALAKAWPRMVFGYTRLDAGRAEALGLMEARPDIAAALMRLRAPMPGLGTITDDTPFNLGFSVNLVELPKVVTELTGAIEKAPWQCPQLTALNKAAHDAATQINNPGLSVAAPLFSGLHAVASTLDWPADAAIPQFSGRLAIASANPASLLGMAKSMLPTLGQVQIPDDGSVVALPEQAGLPIAAPMFAAMQGNAIALGIGSDEQAGLGAFLASDPQDQPLLVAGATGAFYSQLGQWQLRALSPTADAATREQAERQAALFAELYPKLFHHAQMRIDLTARGIEMTQQVVMPQTP